MASQPAQASVRTPTDGGRWPFAVLCAASAISDMGNTLTAMAVPWFIYATSGSATQAGLSGIGVVAAYIIAGVLGGTLVDRVGFRRMSILSDLASGATVALIPLLHATIGLHLWQVLLLVILGALLDAPGSTARQSLLPDLASATGDSLERANARYQSVLHGAGLVGPLLAGLLIAQVGARQVLWIDAATFLLSALLIAAGVPRRAGAVEDARPSNTTAPRGRYWQETGAGLRFIWRDRRIRSLLALSTLTGLIAGGITGVTLLVYASEELGGAGSLGLLYAAAGGGLLLGSLLAVRLAGRVPRRLILLGSLALAALPLWALAATPGVLLAVPLMGLRAAALGPLRPLITTVMQEQTPAAMRGRVLGSARSLGLLTVPLGILLTSSSIDLLGLSPTLAALAALATLALLVAASAPAFRDLEPSAAS